jgi:hypothetical protein
MSSSSWAQDRDMRYSAMNAASSICCTNLKHSACASSVKVQVRDIERNLRSYFRVAIIRAVSKARTDPARWCAGRSNKYWLIPVVFPKSEGHRSERTSCQSSLSNVCPLLLCVFVCVCAC